MEIILNLVLFSLMHLVVEVYMMMEKEEYLVKVKEIQEYIM
jgi:hypothetical protein